MENKDVTAALLIQLPRLRPSNRYLWVYHKSLDNFQRCLVV